MKNDSFPLPFPQLIKSQIVHDDFFKIKADLLQLNNRQYTYYTLVTSAPAVIILGITDENKLVLIEEYRHSAGCVILSCAGGYVDKNESPLEAAKREFSEETGYIAQDFTLMGSAYPYPGISGQKLYYVCATGAKKKGEPKLDPSEVLRTLEMSHEQFKECVKAGKEIDGNLCTALYYYSLNS